MWVGIYGEWTIYLPIQRVNFSISIWSKNDFLLISKIYHQLIKLSSSYTLIFYFFSGEYHYFWKFESGSSYKQHWRISSRSIQKKRRRKKKRIFHHLFFYSIDEYFSPSDFKSDISSSVESKQQQEDEKEEEEKEDETGRSKKNDKIKNREHWELLLDENELSKTHSYFDIGQMDVPSTNSDILAYCVDYEGNETYDIFIKVFK